MIELPKGWTRTKLAAVSQRITKGSTPTSYGYKYQDKGISFIKVENLRNGAIDAETIKHYISEEANQNQKRSILQDGDILFSIAGTIGAIALVRKENLPANTNQALAIIRGSSQFLDPDFLRYQLQSEIAREQSRELERGGGMNNLSLEDVGNLSIVVPPLNEQRRVLAKLERLLNRVNIAQERLASIPRILKRFRQSVLAAACSGQLTRDWRENNDTGFIVSDCIAELQKQRYESASSESYRRKLKSIYDFTEQNKPEGLPHGWLFVALDKLCESFDYGTSAKSQSTGSMPVLRMGNLQNGVIDWTDLVYTSEAHEITKYKLAPNTVLFNRTNSPELVGKTAIYKGERTAIFAGYLIRINNYPILDSSYLNYCLNTPYAKRFCLSVKGDGVSQSNINAQKLAKFEVPFCSLKEQQEIVRRVDRLFKSADELEARYINARVHVDKLTQSILSKAFRGELVPQDPRDEPASVLLDRVRQQRNGAGTTHQD